MCDYLKKRLSWYCGWKLQRRTFVWSDSFKLLCLRMKSWICNHSNESYKLHAITSYFSPWLKILSVWTFKSKLQSLFSYGSVLIVNVWPLNVWPLNVWPLNVWPFKENSVVLRMKATKAYFATFLFQTFESVYEILNV